MKIIKSIFIWVVLISPFINIFADVLPKQSFKGQLVIVQELKINNDTVRLGVSSEGQLLRYDGTKYTNWTPDFDSLYSVDSVKYLRGRIQIYQGGNVDSTEVLTVDTTQVLNLQQFVENHSINQELDPVYSIDSSFIKSSLRDIISDTANWNIEDDPIYKSDSSFLKSNIRDWNSSVAKLITAEDTTYWNSKLDIELDPIYSNDSTFLNSGVRNWNSSLAKTIDATDTTHWGRAETDPYFNTWDKHTGITITESQITDLDHFTTSDEIDPHFAADSSFIKSGTRSWNSSLAKTIDANDTTWWGRAETDPKYAADSANIVKYVGNDRDLDMGTNSVKMDTSYQNVIRIGSETINGICVTENEPTTLVVSKTYLDSTLDNVLTERVISIPDTTGSFQINLNDTCMINSLVLYGSGTVKIGTTTNSDNVMMTQSFSSKIQISFSHKIVPPILYFTSTGAVNFRLWYNKIYGTEAGMIYGGYINN